MLGHYSFLHSCYVSGFSRKIIINKFEAYPMKRNSFYRMMTALTVTFTVICFMNPEINHNALHFFAIPCVAIVIYAVSNDKKWPSKWLSILEFNNEIRNNQEAQQNKHFLVSSWLLKLVNWSKFVRICVGLSIFSLLLAPVYMHWRIFKVDQQTQRHILTARSSVFFLSLFMKF